MDEFKFTGFLWRLGFSLVLVFLTFNPSGHSYYHWLAEGFPQVQPLEAVAGIVLLGLWIFFVRSTLLALGAVGVALLLALAAAVIWWVATRGWLDLGNRQAMGWIVLTVLGLLLGVGMSWSHIRRRVSGQSSVDRVDA